MRFMLSVGRKVLFKIMIVKYLASSDGVTYVVDKKKGSKISPVLFADELIILLVDVSLSLVHPGHVRRRVGLAWRKWQLIVMSLWWMVIGDQGCTTVEVKERLVPDSKFSSNIFKIKLAHDMVFEYPEANVTINSPLFAGDTLPACMSNHIYDLIIR